MPAVGRERRSDVFVCAREKDCGAQGKNREPGLQENPVRDFTGRRGLLGEPYKKPRESVVFYWRDEAGKLLCLR